MTENQLLMALTTLVKGNVLDINEAERCIDKAVVSHHERMTIYYELHTYLNVQKENQGIRKLRTA